MKIFQLFIVATAILTGVLFGLSSWLGLSLSTTEWIVSDIILGTVLYLGYLVVAAYNSDKIRTGYSSDKVTA